MASHDLDLTRLKGHKLFVGTPMYSGQCHSDYAFAIAQLAALCTQTGIELRFHFACHEALVTRARNMTVDEFLRSGDDTLIFIDADIGFDPRDVVTALALQALQTGSALDVVAAPYPLKRIAWDGLLQAAKSGLADDNPEYLARYASQIKVNPAGQTSFQVNALVEVTQAGTGFMMIRRETFERVRAHEPGRRYRSDHASQKAGASPWIHAFFETDIDDGEFISEDFAFCRRVRAAGMQVWLCPWMELNHTGSHRFTGRLSDIARLADNQP